MPFVAAIKATLGVLGHPVGSMRRPSADLDPASLARIEKLVAELQLETASA